MNYSIVLIRYCDNGPSKINSLKLIINNNSNIIIPITDIMDNPLNSFCQSLTILNRYLVFLM